jgi:hypothetical protein
MVQAIFGLLNTIYVGPLVATLAKLFRFRATAATLAFSLTVMMRALSPAFTTWLIGGTGDAHAPTFVVIGSGMLSGFAVLRTQTNTRSRFGDFFWFLEPAPSFTVTAASENGRSTYHQVIWRLPI